MLYDPNWTPPKIKLEPWQEIMMKAADLIEQKGWTRGSLQSDGKFCAMGAMLKVSVSEDYHGMGSLNDHYTDTLQRFMVFLRVTERSNVNHRHVWQWNDALAKNKEDVIATMREFAAKG